MVRQYKSGQIDLSIESTHKSYILTKKIISYPIIYFPTSIFLQFLLKYPYITNLLKVKNY